MWSKWQRKWLGGLRESDERDDESLEVYDAVVCDASVGNVEILVIELTNLILVK